MRTDRSPMGPYRIRLLAMILEAGVDGITTKELSEQLKLRYPENQRAFIARNVAPQLRTIRDIYVELLDGGRWRVKIVPPKTPVSLGRRVKLSDFEKALLQQLIRAGAEGATFSELCSATRDATDAPSDWLAFAFAQLIAHECVRQGADLQRFRYAFLGSAKLAEPVEDVPRVPPPVPAWLQPRQSLFAEDPTFTHLNLKRSQRQMLEVVRLAGKDGITIQDIARKLGKKTANGVTVTLGALANHGCVHQLDARSQHWYFGPYPRSTPL